MAVERIEKYGDVLKVILKPTKKFPNGYFYTDDNEITRELIENSSWCLVKNKNNIYVVAHAYGRVVLRFHQEYAKRVLGYYPDYIDHINGFELDNRDSNLNVVTMQQNARNKPSKGYCFSESNCFVPKYKLNGKVIYGNCYKSEPETLLAALKLRGEIFSDYDYNFLLDRRDASDIVDLELTGQITQEQATEMHVRRYVENNPWYVYRYGLEDYCKEHNIIVPDFDIDSQGFMINSVTKQRLCPC